MAPLRKIQVCDLQPAGGGTDSDRASPSTCAREPATGEGRLTPSASPWIGKLETEEGSFS